MKGIYIFVIGSAILLGYLFVSGGLTRELFLILACLIGLGILLASRQKEKITLEEAIRIGKEKLIELRNKGVEIPQGEIFFLGEGEMKKLLFLGSEEVEDDAYNLAFVVESSPRAGFLVKISPTGELEGISRLKAIESFNISSIPRFKEVSAKKEKEKRKFLEIEEKGEEEK
jgi:hypothetical protein